MHPIGIERLIGGIVKQAVDDYRESMNWLEYLDYRIALIEKKKLNKQKKVKKPLNPSRRYLLQEQKHRGREALLRHLKGLRASRKGDLDSIERWLKGTEYIELLTDGSLTGEDVIKRLKRGAANDS